MYTPEIEKPKATVELTEVRGQYGVAYEPVKEKDSLTANELHSAVTEIDNRIISLNSEKDTHEIGSNEYIQAIYKGVGLSQARDIILKYL